MMDYDASITYRTPITENAIRAEQATAEGRFLGLRCPICERTYIGGKGYCPVDTIELTADHEVDLPQTGVLTNYTIITPIQYPGQTETEPFARVHVLLDGSDVVMRLPEPHRGPQRPGAHRHAGRRGLGVGGRDGSGGGWSDATSSAGSRPASPTSTTPILVNRIN